MSLNAGTLTPGDQIAAVIPHAGGLPKTRLDALTSLRFFAASAIVLHHVQGNFGTVTSFALVRVGNARG